MKLLPFLAAVVLARPTSASLLPSGGRAFLPSKPSDADAGISLSKRGAAVLDIPRGGVGPLPVEDTAKVASAFYLAHALYQKLAPAKSAQKYGYTVDPPLEYACGVNADLNLSLGISACLLFFKTPSSANRAVGAGMLAMILGNIGVLLNDPVPRLEFVTTTGQLMQLAINGFVTYVLLSGADYADLTLKAFSIWLLANGILCALDPNQADDAWGGEAEDTTAGGRAKIRIIGGNCMALGTFCHALALDKSPTQAFGLAFIPIVANLLSCLYLSPADFKDAGVKLGPVYGWIAALLVGIATLAFPEAAASAQ